MKKLALAILLAFSTSVYAQTVNPTNGSVSTTGNLIDPNAWTGAVYLNPNQVAAVEGGFAVGSPEPTPIFNTGTNTIRFSYMPYTVSQMQAINSALFNNGTNVQVTGYNYSWRLFGDNGFLNVTGSLYDTKGSLLDSVSYNYQFSPAMPKNWDLISGTTNFNSPYSANTLGSMGITITGSDSVFWSGYYGPRIRDINVSFNYTVAPTKITTPTTSTTTDYTAVSEPPKEVTTDPIKETTVASSSTSSEPKDVPTQTTQPTSSQTTSNTTQVAVQTVQPAVQTIQPSSTQATNTQQSNGPSLSSVLNTIQSNARREQAIVNTAVANANEVAQSAVLATEQTATSVATMSSNASQQMSIQQVGTAQQASTQSSSLAQGLPLLNSNSITQNTSAGGAQIGLLTPAEITSLSIQPVIAQTVLPTSQTTMTDLRSTDVETNMFASNFLSNRANPLTEIVENNTRPSNSANEQKERPMNKNAQTNELAGGVDIDRMTTQPVGYNAYLQLALRDVAFYAPKEIYRNQRVIDNQGVVRVLNFASELKHQEMVEQQYRR